MKKIALFLALLMLATVCFSFCACSDSSADTPDIEDEISSEVEYALMAKIALQNVTSGKSYYYYTHTITVRENDDGEYRVSGTVTAMSSGTKYYADYSGIVEYDAQNNEYDVDIEMGKLR